MVPCFPEDIAAPEPEPVPVVEKPVRSRGKTPVTTRTSSRRQAKVRYSLAEIFLENNALPLCIKMAFILKDVEETPKKTSESVVEDILANDISTPTGIRFGMA